MPNILPRGQWLVGAAAVVMVVSGCGKSDETANTAGGAVGDTAAAVAPAPGAATTMNADEADDRVEDALRADTSLAAFALDADDERGNVVIEGTVATEAQKAQAATVAATAAPGLTVDNQIRVSAAKREAAHTAADEADDKVEDALEADSAMRDLDIDVDDDDGRLVLKGDVKTAALRTQVEDMVKRTAPGIAIVNQIKVE